MKEDLENFRVQQRKQIIGKIKFNFLKPENLILSRKKESKIFKIFPETLQKIYFRKP